MLVPTDFTQPDPCCPSEQRPECRSCSRLAPQLTMPADCRPKTVVIDPAAILKASGPCPMRRAHP